MEEEGVSLTLAQLQESKEIFEETEELEEDTFIDTFKGRLGCGERRLRTWFRQIDANANGSVDWDEFSSFVLLDGQRQEASREKENVSTAVYRNHPAMTHDWSPEFSRCHGAAVTSCAVLPPPRGATGLACGQSPARIFTGSADGTVRSWSGSTLKHEATVVTPSWILDTKLTQNGRRLITAHTERSLCVIDTQRMDVVAVLTNTAKASFDKVGRVTPDEHTGGSSATSFSTMKRGLGSTAALPDINAAGPPGTGRQADAFAAYPRVRPNVVRMEGLEDVPFCIETISVDGIGLSPDFYQESGSTRATAAAAAAAAAAASAAAGNGRDSEDGREWGGCWGDRGGGGRGWAAAAAAAAGVTTADGGGGGGTAHASAAQDEGTLLCIGLRNGDLIMYHLEAEHITQRGQLRDDSSAEVLAPTHKWTRAHGSVISGVRWAESICNIITVGWDGVVKFLNAETCRVARVLAVGSTGGAYTAYQDQSIFGYDWSGGLKMLATFGAEHHLCLWNPYISTPITKLPHPTGISDVAFSPEGPTVLTLTDDKYVKVWDVRTFRCLQTVKQQNHFRQIHKICFHRSLPGGTGGLAVCSTYPTVLTEARPEVKRARTELLGVLHNSDTATYIVTAEATHVSTWSAGSGDLIFRFCVQEQAEEYLGPGKEWRVTCAALDANGRRLLTGTRCGKVLLWNFINGQLMKVCVGVEEGGRGACPDDPDVTFVCQCAQDTQDARSIRYIYGTVRNGICVWEDGDAFSTPVAMVWRLPGEAPGEVISSLAYAAPSTLVVGTTTGRVVSWNVKSAMCSGSFRRAPRQGAGTDVRGSVRAVCAAVAAADAAAGSGGLRHAAEEEDALRKGMPRVALVAFVTETRGGREARLSVVVYSDGLVQLVNVRRREAVYQWVVGKQREGRLRRITALTAFGSTVVTGDEAGWIRLWEVDFGALASLPMSCPGSPTAGLRSLAGSDRGNSTGDGLSVSVVRTLKFQVKSGSGAVRHITVLEHGGEALQTGLAVGREDRSVALYSLDGALIGVFGSSEKWVLAEALKVDDAATRGVDGVPSCVPTLPALAPAHQLADESTACPITALDVVPNVMVPCSPTTLPPSVVALPRAFPALDSAGDEESHAGPTPGSPAPPASAAAAAVAAAAATPFSDDPGLDSPCARAAAAATAATGRQPNGQRWRLNRFPTSPRSAADLATYPPPPAYSQPSPRRGGSPAADEAEPACVEEEILRRRHGRPAATTFAHAVAGAVETAEEFEDFSALVMPSLGQTLRVVVSGVDTEAQAILDKLVPATGRGDPAALEASPAAAAAGEDEERRAAMTSSGFAPIPSPFDVPTPRQLQSATTPYSAAQQSARCGNGNRARSPLRACTAAASSASTSGSIAVTSGGGAAPTTAGGGSGASARMRGRLCRGHPTSRDGGGGSSGGRPRTEAAAATVLPLSRPAALTRTARRQHTGWCALHRERERARVVRERRGGSVTPGQGPAPPPSLGAPASAASADYGLRRIVARAAPQKLRPSPLPPPPAAAVVVGARKPWRRPQYSVQQQPLGASAQAGSLSGPAAF